GRVVFQRDRGPTLEGDHLQAGGAQLLRQDTPDGSHSNQAHIGDRVGHLSILPRRLAKHTIEGRSRVSPVLRLGRDRGRTVDGDRGHLDDAVDVWIRIPVPLPRKPYHAPPDKVSVAAVLGLAEYAFDDVPPHELEQLR